MDPQHHFMDAPNPGRPLMDAPGPGRPLMDAPDPGRPQVRKSWFGRNWKWFMPTCVGAPILACGGFITLMVMLVFGMIKGSEVYQTAVQEAKSDSAVTAALGTPIEEGFLVTGNIEVSPSSGYADLAIPISGPRGTATIYAVAEKYGDEWYFSTLEVAIADGSEWVDLLAEP